MRRRIRTFLATLALVALAALGLFAATIRGGGRHP
jgi:hypothetical protein